MDPFLIYFVEWWVQASGSKSLVIEKERRRSTFMFIFVPSVSTLVTSVRKGRDPSPRYPRRKMFLVTVRNKIRSQKSVRPTTYLKEQLLRPCRI